MQNNQSGQESVFSQLLKQNSNTEGCKDLIKDVAKAIEQRTFWYFTSDEAGFLNKVYDKQLDSEVLKKRIQQITSQKMSEVMDEILIGDLKKMRDSQGESLEVQLSIKNFYQQMPNEGDPVRRSKQKVKEINEDFKRFKEEVEDKKRLIESRKQEKQTLENQFRKSLEKERREEQRKQIRQHIENIKKQEMQRKEDNQKFKAFMKEFKQAKPMHVLMEEIYKQKVILPTLEENKKKLEALAHKKKPSLEEINDHDRVYMQTKSSRLEKTVLLNHTIDVSYKSQFYKHEQELEREKKEFEETGPSWDFLEKQKRYSQFVKDKVKPRISRKLKQSLEETIKKSHVVLQSPDRNKYIEVGMNYLEFMRNLEKRRISTPINPVETIKESRYFNYLDELKAKSERHNSSMDWERDMKDRTSSKLQKRERVLMKSKQLQEKAMRDQKLVSNYNYDRAEQIIAKRKQIDETLLSSIKAKVAILKDARQP